MQSTVSTPCGSYLHGLYETPVPTPTVWPRTVLYINWGLWFKEVILLDSGKTLSCHWMDFPCNPWWLDVPVHQEQGLELMFPQTFLGSGRISHTLLLQLYFHFGNNSSISMSLWFFFYIFNLACCFFFFYIANLCRCVFLIRSKITNSSIWLRSQPLVFVSLPL